MTLLLRFGPYVAIAALSLLLYAANANIDELDARLHQAAAECNARISDGAAKASRVAIAEKERAVKAERERWQDLIARSNRAAAAAEREREEAEAKATELQSTINDIYQRDSDAAHWRDTPLPAAIRGSLRRD